MNRFLLDDMLKWGVVPRKTYKFVEPTIPDEYLKDYFRGWFDGDGCFYFKKRPIVTITGNKNAMEWYKENLCRIGYYGPSHLNTVKDGQVWCHLKICGKMSIIKFADLIDGEPKLDRKWQLYYNMKKEYNPFNLKENKKGFISNTGNFVSYQDMVKNISDWSKYFGVSRNTMYYHLVKNNYDTKKTFDYLNNRNADSLIA